MTESVQRRALRAARLSQRFVPRLESWSALIAGIVAPWSVTLVGVVFRRWEVAIFGPLLVVTFATLLAADLLRTARRGELRTRLRLGELWALHGLQSGKSLPALEGPAIGIEGAYALASVLRENAPTEIVELGPGASSTVIHLAANAVGPTARMTALEHDDRYVAVVEGHAARLSIPSLRVLHAPLEHLSLPDWGGPWYATDVVDELPESIDLLVVDGPPNYENGDNRYPALPVLGRRLRSGALVYVDDTDRPSERHMVERWVNEFPCEVEVRGETFTLLRWSVDAASED